MLGICSVGGLKTTHGVGTLLVPDDFWCPGDVRRVYDDARAHVLPTLSAPLRGAVLEAVRRAGEHPLPGGCYANARGPRFETRAEIRMMADYCDVVGMTGAHEASACVETAQPYAMLAIVDNYAHGVSADVLSLDSFHAAQAANLATVERCVAALLRDLPGRAAALFPPAAAADAGAAGGAAGGAGALPAAPPAPQAVDLLVHARWVLPVAAGREGAVYDAHAVAVRGGVIVDILPSAEAARAYTATVVTHLGERHALLPGLVNAHTHLAMNLLRGVADDLPLLEWLQTAIWPAEGRLVAPDFVAAGARAAAAELIRGGVTCVSDMYFFPEATAAVLRDAGLRGLVAGPVLEFPSAYAPDADAYLQKAAALRAALPAAGARAGRVRAALGPHAPYTVADATLAKVAAAAAADGGCRVHMHVHETADEVRASTSGEAHAAKHLSEQRCAPLANLARLGLLNERLVAVHMTALTDGEIGALAAARASVVHCPSSNLKLASGFAPVARLAAAGVNVALGTDGAASNNSLDMFAEMKLAALLAKGVAGDATAVPAAAALRMATLNGARALGLGDVAGSLEVGKAFDAVAVDLGALEAAPCYSVVSHLVYAASRADVTDVWVDGAPLLVARALTTIDEAAALADVRAWAQRVKEKATAWDGAARIDDAHRAPHGCMFKH